MTRPRRRGSPYAPIEMEAHPRAPPRPTCLLQARALPYLRAGVGFVAQSAALAPSPLSQLRGHASLTPQDHEYPHHHHRDVGISAPRCALAEGGRRRLQPPPRSHGEICLQPVRTRQPRTLVHRKYVHLLGSLASPSTQAVSHSTGAVYCHCAARFTDTRRNTARED